jgi:hypothetical protein
MKAGSILIFCWKDESKLLLIRIRQIHLTIKFEEIFETQDYMITEMVNLESIQNIWIEMIIVNRNITNLQNS